MCSFYTGDTASREPFLRASFFSFLVSLPKRALRQVLRVRQRTPKLTLTLTKRALNKATQRVADQRTQDEALQAYLGKMSELLIDEKLHEKADRYDEVRVTARAQTLTVLGRLDADHKKTVLLFLREARLINRYDYRPDQEPDQESKEEPKEEPKSVFDTVKSVFGKVQASLASRLTNREPSEEPKEEPERLYYAQYVGLEDADLSAANLKGARLINTDRDQPVSLKGAILEGTDLQGADLEGADLQGADLSNADLSEADLSGANLYRAELSEADLRGAKEWTAKQLAAAESLAGATMPDGEILKGPTTPDEPTFDDWRAFFHHRIP
jgi:Pentapeptide repeats (8 copies)